MAGAALLDLDKPFIHFFERNPFPTVVRHLHEWVQNESAEGLANEIRFGVAFAAADALAAVLALRNGDQGRRPQAQPRWVDRRPKWGEELRPDGDHPTSSPPF